MISPGLATVLLYWLGLVSLVGLLAMGLDKLLAKGGFSRIRERTLWIVALLGGFPGIVLGGFLFHHKTSKASFWGPVIAAVLIWVAPFIYFHHYTFGF